MEYKKIESKNDLSEKDDCDIFLIESSEKEARKIIASLKDRARNSVPSRMGTGVPASSGKFKGKIGLFGGDDVFNRRAVETLNIDYLISPEGGHKRDGLKQRDSGLNHVVAKEAAKRGINIVIDFDEISKLKGKEKALRLGRVIQNIKICLKAKCDIKIWDFSKNIDKKALVSFGISLGMSSSQASKSTVF